MIVESENKSKKSIIQNFIHLYFATNFLQFSKNNDDVAVIYIKKPKKFFLVEQRVFCIVFCKGSTFSELSLHPNRKWSER